MGTPTEEQWQTMTKLPDYKVIIWCRSMFERILLQDDALKSSFIPAAISLVSSHDLTGKCGPQTK